MRVRKRAGVESKSAALIRAGIERPGQGVTDRLLDVSPLIGNTFNICHPGHNGTNSSCEEEPCWGFFWCLFPLCFFSSGPNWRWSFWTLLSHPSITLWMKTCRSLITGGLIRPLMLNRGDTHTIISLFKLNNLNFVFLMN